MPVLGLLGVYGWMALTQAPPPEPVTLSAPALQATVSALQTQDLSIASSVKAAIETAYQDLAKLVANHSDADYSNFVSSHSGLMGVAVFSANGKLLKTVPATAQLADPAYGSSDEFKGMMAKFKDNGGQTNLFFTRRLSYPAFVFSVPLSSNTVAQAVMNLASFFGTSDPRKGEVFLIDGDSGEVFYHSTSADSQSSFNAGQDPFLSKIQADLAAKKSGSEPDPPTRMAVYTTLGIKSFGMVRLLPLSALQPASRPAAQPKAPLDALQDIFQTPIGMPLLIAAAAALGWIFLVGSMGFGMITASLRKAGATVLNAAKGTTKLTPEVAKRFGNDEVGQIVQASALLMQKLEEDRERATEERDETLKRGRAELDTKTREAGNQAATAQQQAQAAKNELSGVNQQLNDKLKELDAMKGMSEGLRNQTEQAKAEIGKLKSQVTAAEDAKAEAQKKLSQTQAQLEDQLKEMEAKMLSTVAATSAIQVSSVRAAAIRTMSEELKTTLGIIKGYVSSALGTAAGGINEKQQEFLGMVINRSARLEKFINDLVDIYQVEIEQEKAPHEEVNLPSEIESLAFNFQAQADVKNIKMKVETKGTIPKVPVVRRRFNQLWNILYLQVIKDAPRGSAIPITVESIGDNVKITIQDPGLTVAPEALPRLFDEFYDPKHTASPQLAGTGLKFALIKTILAAHGGGAVAEKGDPGTRLLLTFSTKIKKPGEIPAPVIGLRPAATPAPGLKPPAPSFGAPRPPAPTGMPGSAPPGLPKPPIAPPSFGMPKPAVPAAPAATGSAPPAVPGLAGFSPAGPKPPASSPGLMDSLISKVPSVNAPGVKPPVAPVAPAAPVAPTATPAAPKPPGAASFGMVGSAPKAPAPAAPGAPPAAPNPPVAPGTPPALGAPKPPSATSGLLDSLMGSKPPTPTSAAPPAIPAAPKPPGAASFGMVGSAPKAPTPPGVPPAAPSIGGPPKPPGFPPSFAPKPAAPVVPGAPTAPRPPISIPGMPASGAPVAPKVIPTNLKPTTPPPGILDLDNADGMKLDAGAPKPPAAPPLGAPRPPMPGAPPMGAPKPPVPGVPPGGLDASKAQKAKDGEGELIE